MALHQRWQAKVIYRTEAGPLDVVHDLAEIGDLHDLVEAGPDWDTIIRIEIVRVNHNHGGVGLTVERAMCRQSSSRKAMPFHGSKAVSRPRPGSWPTKPPPGTRCTAGTR